MQLLVSGGAGFIGSHLCERLLETGHYVRVLDNLSTGRRTNLPTHDRLDFIQGDIRDSADVDHAVRGVDAIYHLAAVASVQASVDDPVGTHASNLVGTLNLLEASRRYAVQRFVYASSAAVYGDNASLPVHEDTVLRPLSPYATDKLAGEHYLFFYAREYGFAATAFRFFNIYGPRQDPLSPYSGVISVFVDRARNAQPVTIFGDGQQTRDFVYVADLVEILQHALTADRANGVVINVGRGTESSLLDVLHELERLFGRKIDRRHEPARLGDIRKSCADIERLVSLLDYRPRTSLGAGLARLVAYADR